jgi:uncharacterized HAD superfamily protein
MTNDESNMSSEAMATGQTRRPVVGVDLDNVLADTDTVIRQLIAERYGIVLQRRDIVEFDYWLCGITREQTDEVLRLFHEGECAKALPTEQSASALQVLRTRYEIWILTARPQLAQQATEHWLQQHGLEFDRLIHDGKKLAHSEELAVAIEDHRETAYGFARAGVRTFLFDYPWNQPTDSEPSNLLRINGWHEIVDLLAMI